MNSEEYWKERGEQNAVKENDYAMKQAALITRWFERAKKEMQKKINEFYKKYGDGENISVKQAKANLNDPNILRTTLDEYYQLIENSADYEGAKKALDKMSAKRSINRLELLQLQLDMILNEAYIKYEDITLTSLSHAFDEAYYKMMYDQQQFQGYGDNFNRLSVNQILAAVSTNWSGKNYSERIHDNRVSLARRMNRIITTGVITGRSNKQMRQQLEKETDLSSYHARRLVRTEASYVTGQAKMLAYKENDTKKYRFLAVLDLKTSEICRSLDGKVFLVKDAQPGVNCNPMHPHCRSATVPETVHDPDDTRKARDENGNTYTVPADMTYKEWYDKYVRNNPKALLQEKCLKNIYADNVQYNKYKSVLGKDIPKTLEDFQKLKYTNYQEWENLKRFTAYKRKYPNSDRLYFDINNIINVYKENGTIGLKVGTAIKPTYIKITEYGVHALNRMYERNFGTEDAQSYINNAVIAFSQAKGKKTAYYSEKGVSVVNNQTGKLETGWNITDFDEQAEMIIKAAKKYAKQ